MPGAPIVAQRDFFGALCLRELVLAPPRGISWAFLGIYEEGTELGVEVLTDRLTC